MATDFTIAHDLAERLRDLDNCTLQEDAAQAADLIERMADRINHLTNICEGNSETIAELRTGLAELREMCSPEKSA